MISGLLGLFCVRLIASAAFASDNLSVQAGAGSAQKTLLPASRLKGEYKGPAPIMIDFWLSNAKLAGDGGKYKVRYAIDGGAPKLLEKWEPLWLAGWASGKHSIKRELGEQKGQLVENGDYNSTTPEITVVQ